MKLFCLLTGIKTVTEIEQYHLHVFEERLANTPLNCNRFQKDAELTLAVINIRAEGLADEELGRSVSTINSHIDTIGAVLRHARAFDHNAVHTEINTRLVRRREKRVDTKNAMHLNLQKSEHYFGIPSRTEANPVTVGNNPSSLSRKAAYLSHH